MPWPLESCPRRESRSVPGVPSFLVLIARLSINPSPPPFPFTTTRLHCRFGCTRLVSGSPVARQSAKVCPQVNRFPNHCQELTGSAVFRWNVSCFLPFLLSPSLSVAERLSEISSRSSTFGFSESAYFRPFISVYQSLSRPPSRCSSISPRFICPRSSLLVLILDRIAAASILLVSIRSSYRSLRFFQSISL